VTPCTQKERILVVDDSPDTLDILQQNLASRGYEVTGASGAAEALGLMAGATFDLVLTDMKMPGMTGIDLTRIVREQYPGMEVMMITGYATVENAVEALKTGAEEYLAKPFTDEELFAAVDRVAAKLRARREARAATRGRFGLIGESEGMRRAFAAIEQAARQTGPVLILGEAGTGRRAAIRAVRMNGSAGPAPTLTFDCGDLAGFQAEKALELLQGAALHLTNLHKAGADMQERIRMLIANPPRQDAQIFFAADPDLPLLVGHGIFSADLYNLVSANTVALPPVRERGDDAILLAEHFVVSLAEIMGRAAPALSIQAQRAIRAYPWPGNVEELRAVVTGAVLQISGMSIDLSDFPLPFRDALGGVAERSLAEAEADHILRVLAYAGGQRGRAADILRIDRKTLREKLKGLAKEGRSIRER
jgi:two-component system, NtrC family, response regulator HydG